MLNKIILLIGLLILSLSILRLASVIDRRERAKLQAELIRMSGEICRGYKGAEYNEYTGYFTCK